MEWDWARDAGGSSGLSGLHYCGIALGPRAIAWHIASGRAAAATRTQGMAVQGHVYVAHSVCKCNPRSTRAHQDGHFPLLMFMGARRAHHLSVSHSSVAGIHILQHILRLVIWNNNRAKPETKPHARSKSNTQAKESRCCLNDRSFSPSRICLWRRHVSDQVVGVLSIGTLSTCRGKMSGGRKFADSHRHWLLASLVHRCWEAC
jgi:hypothetical protein